ncbi:MAG: hypothetical protein IAE80_23525, partial [Anaerolinea sp.]|nr:hypothetical protein [Anaerolinea sp.]
LYWVDDYKTCYADERTFTRFLQSYSREMGRGRLTREAKLRQERPCRGLLLSTGETTIEGEASILSRMLVLEIPPWERRDPQGKALAAAEAQRPHLPAFTAQFAQWMAAKADAGTLTGDLAARYVQNDAGYRAKLRASLGAQAHSGRITGNWAVLVTVYQLLREFLTEQEADEALPAWQDVVVETVRAVQQERASHVFLDILGQLIAGGQVVIDDDMSSPRDYPPGVTVVGYREAGSIYLLPEIAHREVCRVHPLRFSVTAIGMQLREDGHLQSGTSNLSVQKRVKGGRARFWELTCTALGCDS